MSISHEFKRIGVERGRKAEQVMAHVMKEAIENNKCPEWVQGYSYASCEEDRKRKTDAWVHTDIGRIPLQIKSSRKGVEKARKNNKRIPVVLVRLGEDPNLTLFKCLEAIAPYRDRVLIKRGPWGVPSDRSRE